MRRFPYLFLIAFLLSPTQLLADEGQDAFLRDVEAAVAGGRLIQADRMLERADVRPENQFRLSLIKADLLRAKGSNSEALALYAALARQQPANVRALTGAGLASLGLERLEEAKAWLSRATALKGTGWKAWNGLGIASDRERDWAASAHAYEQAAKLAPLEASIWNNIGYSFLSQHRVEEALAALKRAAELAPFVERIRVNLDLANAAAGRYPDRRKPGETAAQWASRLNNAGYSALLAGDRSSARSLFARAIKASDVRFERAEANLTLTESGQ